MGADLVRWKLKTYAFDAFAPLGPPPPESEYSDRYCHTTYKGRYSDSDGKRGVVAG